MDRKKQNISFLAPFLHLDNVLLEFIKIYFFYHPIYKWSEDDKETKIKIVKAFDKLGQDKDFYPKILLRRNSASLTMPTMFSNYAGGGSLMDFTQKRTKFYRAGSSYYIEIYSRVQGEAQNLAEEIVVNLLLYKDRLAEKFFVNIEEHVEISKEMISTENTSDIKISSISILLLASYTYQVSYDILPRYEKLKNIEVEETLKKAIERKNEIDFKNIKYNFFIEEEENNNS